MDPTLTDLFDAAKEVIRATLETGQDEKLRVQVAQDVLDRLPGQGKQQSASQGPRTNNLLFVGSPDMAAKVMGGLEGFFSKFADPNSTPTPEVVVQEALPARISPTPAEAVTVEVYEEPINEPETPPSDPAADDGRDDGEDDALEALLQSQGML